MAASDSQNGVWPARASTLSESGRPAGSTDDDEPALRVGQTLAGELVLERVLGVGGTSTVYAARRPDGSRVAVKLLHRELAVSRRSRARLLRESVAANQLGPGGVAVLGGGEHQGAAFLVMELLEGETLGQRARRAGGRLPVPELVGWGQALLAVLTRAHELGIVHRDIKPENVFVTTSGELRLVDFGLASLTDDPRALESITQRQTALGTPAFMPPELARGRTAEADARTDVWQVGALLFALASGQHVHLGGTAAEYIALSATQPARPLASVLPSVPPGFAAVVDRALSYLPEHRWSSAAAMARALGEVDCGAEPATARTRGPGERTEPEPLTTPSRPRRFAHALLAAGLVAAAAVRLAGTSAPGDVAPCTDETTAEFVVEHTAPSECSFVSLTSALRAAERSTAPRKTIRLAAGRYGALNTGEHFPLVVRGDVTIVGAGIDETFIEGHGESSHQQPGGALTDDRLEATFLVGAPGSRVELRDLTVRPGRVAPRFHSFGVLCDAGNARHRSPQPAPNLVVERVRFGPGYDSGLVVTTTLGQPGTALEGASGCNARVSASRFEGNWYGLFALGCGAGRGELPTAVSLDAAEHDPGSVFEGTHHLEGSGAGVLLWGCVTSAHLRRARFHGGDIGVQVDQRPPPVTFVDGYDTRIVDATFSEHEVAGLRLWRAPTVAVEGSRFERINGAAVAFDDRDDTAPPTLRARRSVFTDNRVAFSVDHAHARVDLGTHASPGHNVFQCNETTVAAPVEAALQLEGNTWDLPPVSTPRAPPVDWRAPTACAGR